MSDVVNEMVSSGGSTSMALKAALLFQVREQEYALPLTHVNTVMSVGEEEIKVMGEGRVMPFLGEHISIFVFDDILAYKGQHTSILKNEPKKPNTKLEVIVITMNDKHVGIIVDRLLQRKEIFEKNLEKPMDKISIFSGTTILGSGQVCPVVDVVGVVTAVNQMTLSTVTN